MNMQAQVAYRYFQVTVLVALLAALLLAAAPVVLEYAQTAFAQFIQGLFVLGQMDQGVIVN